MRKKMTDGNPKTPDISSEDSGDSQTQVSDSHDSTAHEPEAADRAEVVHEDAIVPDLPITEVPDAVMVDTRQPAADKRRKRRFRSPLGPTDAQVRA
ncbi:MAG: hypothetical protein ABIY38_04035, partial [Rhodococcus sp. (in: high G+C Gram-positive bacteria)]